MFLICALQVVKAIKFFWFSGQVHAQTLDQLSLHCGMCVIVTRVREFQWFDPLTARACMSNISLVFVLQSRHTRSRVLSEHKVLLDRLRSLQTQNVKLARLLEFRHGSNASKLVAAIGSTMPNLSVNLSAGSGELISSAVSAPSATTTLPNPSSERRFFRRPSRLVRTPLRVALPTPR